VDSREFKVLVTSEQYVQEGLEQRHCVSSYWGDHTWIVSCCVDGKRSTAQVNKNKHVLQHRSFANGRVSVEERAALKAWLDGQE